MQRERYRRLVSVLLAVGGALLLLGCANVANRLMVRSVNRGREYGVRLMLGASPGRLLLLPLAEALLLAASGAALGVALAVWLKQLVATLLLPCLAARSVFRVPLDMRVLAVTLGCRRQIGVRVLTPGSRLTSRCVNPVDNRASKVIVTMLLK